VGCDTGRRYRIRRGTSANVNEIDEYGRLGTGRCFVPLGGLAQGDVMLAQKIALETDENRALSIANSFPGPLGWRLPRRRPAEARSSGVRLSPGLEFEPRCFSCGDAAAVSLIATTTLVVDECWIISRTTDGIHCLIDSECSPDRLALEIGNTGRIFVVCRVCRHQA
jgi:hypothetical protein